jgi:hypothetical protein
MTRRYLREAVLANPFVPVYLLGAVKLPRQRPDMIAVGDPSEAVDYVYDFAASWMTPKGAGQ